MKAVLREKRLLLNVNHDFNPTESAWSSKSVLGENAMKEVYQEKISRKKRSSGVTEEIEVIRRESSESEVASPMNAAKINENGTPIWWRKIKEGNTEVEPSNKKIIENNTKKPVGTDEAREIPVVKKEQTSTRNSGPVEHSSLNEQLGNKLPAGYTVSSTEIDEVSYCPVDDCRCPPGLRDHKTDAKYNQITSCLHAFLVPRNLQSNVFLSKKSALFLCDMMWMYGKEAAMNEQASRPLKMTSGIGHRSSEMEDWRCRTLPSVVLEC